MRIEKLEQALSTYCWRLARGGDGVYVNPRDFLDEEAGQLLSEGTATERAAVLETVKEAYPDIAELASLLDDDPEQFREVCQRVGEERAREWGVIERILDEATKHFGGRERAP
jgi:hypothetical protein